jgi:L-amino acid N-acyltransferase YncA
MFNGTIRELQKNDINQVQKIFEIYWTDDGFLEKLNNRLKQFLENSPEMIEQKFRYFVAEENGEIVGISAMRKPPDKIKKYATTRNPVEFYVSASKYKNRGIGTALRNKRIEEAKQQGYSEVLFYSPESHKDSWKFHDSSGGERIYPVSIDDEPGCVWRLLL